MRDQMSTYPLPYIYLFQPDKFLCPLSISQIKDNDSSLKERKLITLPNWLTHESSIYLSFYHPPSKSQISPYSFFTLTPNPTSPSLSLPLSTTWSSFGAHVVSYFLITCVKSSEQQSQEVSTVPSMFYLVIVWVKQAMLQVCLCGPAEANLRSRPDSTISSQRVNHKQTIINNRKKGHGGWTDAWMDGRLKDRRVLDKYHL